MMGVVMRNVGEKKNGAKTMERRQGEMHWKMSGGCKKNLGLAARREATRDDAARGDKKTTRGARSDCSGKID